MARIIGLTGGIASGKSTVARLLRDLGAQIVDADEIAREVVLPGTPALEELVARFGDAVLGEDGSLDRKQLGALVFRDPGARADLNAITHPRIAAASKARIVALVDKGADPVIYEAALLVENRAHEWLDALIVVSVPPEVQVARLMARDNISEREARERLGAQLPLAAKVAVADYVIENSGTLEQTRNRVTELWLQLREMSRAPTGDQ